VRPSFRISSSVTRDCEPPLEACFDVQSFFPTSSRLRRDLRLPICCSHSPVDRQIICWATAPVAIRQRRQAMRTSYDHPRLDDFSARLTPLAAWLIQLTVRLITPNVRQKAFNHAAGSFSRTAESFQRTVGSFNRVAGASNRTGGASNRGVGTFNRTRKTVSCERTPPNRVILLMKVSSTRPIRAARFLDLLRASFDRTATPVACPAGLSRRSPDEDGSLLRRRVRSRIASGSNRPSMVGRRVGVLSQKRASGCD
jgi:hypothetical protein